MYVYIYIYVILVFSNCYRVGGAVSKDYLQPENLPFSFRVPDAGF